MSGDFDPDKVNVLFTSGAGVDETWPRVDTTGDCSGHAWFYDNPSDPTGIILCPDACSSLTLDPSASLTVQLGCLTVTQ